MEGREKANVVSAVMSNTSQSSGLSFTWLMMGDWNLEAAVRCH